MIILPLYIPLLNFSCLLLLSMSVILFVFKIFIILLLVVLLEFKIFIILLLVILLVFKIFKLFLFLLLVILLVSKIVIILLLVILLVSKIFIIFIFTTGYIISIQNFYNFYFVFFILWIVTLLHWVPHFGGIIQYGIFLFLFSNFQINLLFCIGKYSTAPQASRTCIFLFYKVLHIFIVVYLKNVSFGANDYYKYPTALMIIINIPRRWRPWRALGACGTWWGQLAPFTAVALRP